MSLVRQLIAAARAVPALVVEVLDRLAYDLELAGLRRDDRAAGDRTCIMCGCTDSHACPGGCSWTERGPDGTGLCSRCDESLLIR